MTQIVWDQTTKRLYETGVDHGVFYPMDPDDGSYPLGYAWNGLTTVTEKPTGGEANAQYADNIKYINLMSLEEFGATIEAFTYPKEFEACDGLAEPTPGLSFAQQGRSTFGLAYRTRIGNDAEGDSYGYKLHLIYGCMVSPSEKAYATVNDSPAAINFSWDLKTTPVPVSGDDYRPVSAITIDSTLADPTKLAALEDILFGTVEGDPRLPLPDEVITVLETAAPSAVSVTTVPDDEDTGVAVTASVVLTFNNAIAREAVVLATAAGVLKAVARSWDTDHKVLTLDPTTNLAGGTTYLLTIAGVVDVYGQSLAAEVANFATV